MEETPLRGIVLAIFHSSPTSLVVDVFTNVKYHGQQGVVCQLVVSVD